MFIIKLSRMAGSSTARLSLLAIFTYYVCCVRQTYCVDAQIADSACSATAYLCGAKANIETIGVSAHVARAHCTAAQEAQHHVHSIAEWALSDGRDAGNY